MNPIPQATSAGVSSSLPQGVLTPLLEERFPRTPPARTRLGMLGCCVREHFPFDVACANFDAACAELDDAVDGLPIDTVRSPRPIEDPAEMLSAAESMLADGAAGLVLHHSTYTAGEIGAHLGRLLLDRGVPVFSWSSVDPPSERLSANSLCCQNFILNMWHRLGVRYAWAHGSGPHVRRHLAEFAAAGRARARMLHAKLLHAGGSRVTAFYDGETDELAVMKRFGLRFDRVDLVEIAAKADAQNDREVGRLRDALVEHPARGVLDVPDEHIRRTLRFGLALLELAHEGNYLGCTFKSWPELFNHYGCAIDGAVSMLNDYGFTTAEEGEMNGLISSLALNLVSEGEAAATMMDISAADAQLDRIGIWHCGACPTKLLKPGATYDLRRHSILENGDPETAVGQMIEFPLRLGEATVVRYCSPDAARVCAFEGQFVDAEMPFRGAYGLFAPAHHTAAQIVGTILARGLDHHWSVGYGHWRRHLRMLNHWLGVDEIPIDDPGALVGRSRPDGSHHA